MPELPLRLRCLTRSLPLAAAWVPGAEAKAWLSVAGAVTARHPHAVVKLYPLAGGEGALLVVEGGLPGGEALAGSPGLGLGEIFPGVLAPVEAGLEAALTESERQAFFPWPLHFIHPVRGVTGFEAGDGWFPWQLLTSPALEREGWMAAVPGPAPVLPWRQVTLVQVWGGGADFLDAGAEGIGAGEDGGLSGQGAGAWLGAAGGAAAGMLGSLGAGLLGALGQPSAAAAITHWNSRRQQEELQSRRAGELRDLLDRFDRDPLEALRRAIPLTGAEARRGAADTPGWKLGVRNPDLDPLGQGGGMVDVWQIPAETRLKLERKYREAAAREAAAGHWGRAAYIFGSLLGDWNQAAEMLERGGRPREAAQIYRERLQSDRRAAQCLEKAGLLAEAAALYAETGQWEQAGDLWAALGQPEAARQHWETAVSHLSDRPGQARILEKKLNAPDRALMVFEGVSVKAPEALTYFQAVFDLLGRHARHGQAAAWLERLERKPTDRLVPASRMIAGLHHIFSNYPEAAVREQAGALALPLAGESLAAGPAAAAETEALLRLLPLFAPGDRLLARDAGRFSQTAHHPAVPLPTVGGTKARLPDRVIPLDPAVTWEAIAAGPEGPVVLGWDATASRAMGVVCLASGLVGIEQPAQRLTFPEFPPGRPLLNLALTTAQPPELVIHSAADQRVVWTGEAVREVPGVLAMGPGQDGELVLLKITETGVLTATWHGGEGSFRRTRVLDFAPPRLETGRWFTAGQGGDLWIAGMNVVCCVTERGDFQHVAVDGPMAGLAVAPPVLPSQAIAVGAREAVLLIPRGPGKSLEVVHLFTSRTGRPPVAVFTKDGRAIVADREGGTAIFVMDGCRKQADLGISPGSGDLIAATAVGPQGFAFLTRSGRVLGYGW